jgi:benzodiazapine receptor
LTRIDLTNLGAFMPSWVSANLVSLLVFLVLLGATGALGGQWGADAWYKRLSKPAWTPPNWLFPPVWLVLYLMIAMAGWLIWISGDENRPLILGIWAVQLILNASWSYIFFGRHQLGWGLAEIVALWVSIVGFIVTAWSVDQTASLLFFPYLIWVSYAAALNASIWMRNPAAAKGGAKA